MPLLHDINSIQTPLFLILKPVNNNHGVIYGTKWMKENRKAISYNKAANVSHKVSKYYSRIAWGKRGIQSQP